MEGITIPPHLPCRCFWNKKADTFSTFFLYFQILALCFHFLQPLQNGVWWMSYAFGASWHPAEFALRILTTWSAEAACWYVFCSSSQFQTFSCNSHFSVNDNSKKQVLKCHVLLKLNKTKKAQNTKNQQICVHVKNYWKPDRCCITSYCTTYLEVAVGPGSGKGNSL